MSEQNKNPGMALTEKLVLGGAIIGIVLMLGAIGYMYFGDERVDGSVADESLATIRASFRMIQSVEGDLSSLAGKYTSGENLRVLDIKELNLTRERIENPYFDANAFRVTVLTDTSFVIKAIGNFSQSENRARINEYVRSLDNHGVFWDE